MTRKLPLLALAALTLTGCPDLPFLAEITSTDNPGALTGPVTADGKPAAFPKVSSGGKAVYTDLAIDAKGTWHLITTEAGPQAIAHDLQYRASADQGKTWSEPESLGAAQAGYCRLLLDAKGRVYAFWKDHVETDFPSGALHRGTLSYKVLDNTIWSPVTRVGTEKQAMSWYPAMTPGGEVYLVWNETLPFGTGFTPPAEAGLIKKAMLDGATVGRISEIYRPVAKPLPGTSEYHYDSFEGLNGFVDEGGVPQYVVQKAFAQTTEGVASDPTEIMLSFGNVDLPFLKVDQFLKATRHFVDPPALIRDASRNHHVILLDAKSERHGLVDYLTTDNKRPHAEIYRLKQKTGRFKGAQVVRGPQGKAVALMELQDTADQAAPFDLYVATFDGSTWQAPVNLTQNATRAQAVRYNTAFASAAWNAEGKLAVAFVSTPVDPVVKAGAKPTPTPRPSASASPAPEVAKTDVYIHQF